MFARHETRTRISTQNDCRAIPDDVVQQLRLDIDKANYTTRRGEQVLFQGTIRLDPAKEPKEIDFTDVSGENKGKTGKGIYQVDGDTLKICHGMPTNPERPKEFASKPGSGLFVVVWKRQKP